MIAAFDWVGLAVLVTLVLLLMLTSTINLVLRTPSRARIAELLAKKGRQDELRKLIERLPDLTSANGAIRSGSLIALVLVVDYLMGGRGVSGSLWSIYGPIALISWVLLIVFGVAIPSAWAYYAGETVLVNALPAIHLAAHLLYPVVRLLRLFEGLVRRLCGVPLHTAQSQADELEREILNVVSEGEIRGAVDEEEKEMIESVIDLRDTDVEAIMTPRTETIAADKNITLTELKELIAQSGHSRIPIYDGTIDEVLGVLYAKDLLRIDDQTPFDVTEIMRPSLFIPETKRLRDLLHQFQEQKVHMAVVLDEYGGTAGLVTIEDILEELVGEIVDEYEEEEPEPIQRIDENTVEVDASLRIEEINDRLHLDLPEDGDYETIGGFVFSTLGKIPEAGERCTYEQVAITVIAAAPRRITRLRLEGVPEPENNGRNKAVS